MHVVGHIVKYDVESVFVRYIKHLVEFFLGGEAFLDFGSVDRPIAVVTRELGICLGSVVLIAVLEWIVSPCAVLKRSLQLPWNSSTS